MTTTAKHIHKSADIHNRHTRDQYGSETLEEIREKIDFIQANGRLLKTVECGIQFYALDRDIWCIRSHTQFNWDGTYEWQACQKYTNPIDVAFSEGRSSGRSGGIFYCEHSDTLRQWPQNYLLAVRRPDGSFAVTPDKASTINAHSLGLAIRECGDAPSGQVLGKMLTEKFYG